ncbi:hypothetical protein [Planctomyces sp. SH-PL14]|uniref:hypothetical protein n=1 Tax=Planctomyces sp. SH-PL14 TaxID=1632864 RepID=UPI0009465F9E|nr:hypothetical protein [Planctomyces sp. SH-PL14]
MATDDDSTELELEMKGLVLLADEVTLLKGARRSGRLSRYGSTLGHDVACDFFCEAGVTDDHGDELRLTKFGTRLVDHLWDTGAAGTVVVSQAVLEALEAPVVEAEISYGSQLCREASLPASA